MAIKEYLTDKRILALLLIVVSLAILDIQYGGPHLLHFGIEFIGGTQIPVTLGHSVTPDQMASILGILQQRVSTFGLKEVTVEGVGNSQIYVTIPSVSSTEINQTIALIESQGIFQGVVNGKEAVNGSSILSGSIGAAPPVTSGGNVSWAVNFFIYQTAAEHFAKVAFGQANQPLYMFLDRPTEAIVLINESTATQGFGTSSASSLDAAISAMQQSTSLGNETIPIEVLNPSASNWASLSSFFSSKRNLYDKVLLSASTPQFIIDNLTQMNYSVSLQTAENMTPQFTTIQSSPTSQQTIVESWPVIGLLSSPILSPGVTNGTAGQSYQISGAAPVTLSLQDKQTFATQQSKMISSVLSGGALPVHVIVGVPKTVQSTLGSEAMRISGLIAVLSMASVALVIVIRYKKLFLVLPILLTTMAELFIIVSIIGLVGTIDLAAVAGMIAVVGTGVDAQIIITDEVLFNKIDHGTHGVKTHIGNAFYVVWASAILLIISMLPLLFSTSLVSIIGFAESTILGALLGALITRPAYGAIISKHFSKGAKNG